MNNIFIQNWTDARSFCNASGMSLATIKTEQQRTALSNAAWVLPNGMHFGLIFPWIYS